MSLQLRIETPSRIQHRSLGYQIQCNILYFTKCKSLSCKGIIFTLKIWISYKYESKSKIYYKLIEYV
jgi:hypothetical protein